MKTTNYILLLFLLMVAPSIVSAQVDSTCYNNKIKEGKQAHKQEDFELAINSFIIASYCPDAKKSGEVERLISKTLNAWVRKLDEAREKEKKLKEEEQQLRTVADSLYSQTLQYAKDVEKERNIAESERTKAALTSRLFYGISEADDARLDLQDSLLLPGLMKVFDAYAILKETTTPIPPNVYTTFGEAVYKNFGKTLPYQHQNGVIDINCSDAGAYFYSIGRDTTLIVWSYQVPGDHADSIAIRPVQIKQENYIKDMEHYIMAADFSKKKGEIAYGGRSHKLNKQALNSPNTIPLKNIHQSTIVKVKYLPNGNLLTAGRDGRVILWDGDGNLIKIIIEETELPFVDLELSKEGHVALARTMQSVYYWETNHIEQVAALAKVDSGLIYTATISPNGKMVLISYSDNHVELWENGISKNTFTAASMPLALKFAPDNKSFLIGALEGLIQKGYKESGEWKTNLLKPHKGVEYFVNSEKHSHFLSVGLDHKIQIFDTEGGSRMLEKHKGPITSVAFSPNQQDSIFVSTSLDGTVNLWSFSGDSLMEANLGSAVVKAMFTNDGNYIIAGTEKGELIMIPTPMYVYEKLYEGKGDEAFQEKEIEQKINEKINNYLDK